MVNARKGTKGFLEVPVAQRFWSKVSVGTSDECWAWNGSCGNHGRGQFWLNGRNQAAPRIAWSLHWGRDFPADLLACHSCDNPNCCNPAHIWPGTMQDNILDAVAKGRVDPSLMLRTNHNAVKTHCIHGHEFTPENTYSRNGTRNCLTCLSASKKEYRARVRARAALEGG